jgi:hypothetical protein
MDHILVKVDRARSILEGKPLMLGRTAYERNERLKKEAEERRNGKRKAVYPNAEKSCGGKFANPCGRDIFTKREGRLFARQEAHQRMVDDPKFKAPAGAFHRPGSMNK